MAALQTNTTLMQSPELQINWLGFRASAWDLQCAGWRFEEFVDSSNVFRDTLSIIARHPGGMSGLGEVPRRDLMQAISLDGRYRSEIRAVVDIKRMSLAAKDFIFQAYSPMQNYRVVSLDMEPAILELTEKQAHRFTLADLFPERPPEEIIVEPATVMSLLEQIKQMQAPELADMRARNRRRDARDRIPEVRHATILSLAA